MYTELTKASCLALVRPAYKYREIEGKKYKLDYSNEVFLLCLIGTRLHLNAKLFDDMKFVLLNSIVIYAEND